MLPSIILYHYMLCIHLLDWLWKLRCSFQKKTLFAPLTHVVGSHDALDLETETSNKQLFPIVPITMINVTIYSFSNCLHENTPKYINRACTSHYEWLQLNYFTIKRMCLHLLVSHWNKPTKFWCSGSWMASQHLLWRTWYLSTSFPLYTTLHFSSHMQPVL